MHPEPRDQRLFYYTRQLGHLLSVLQDGFWPRYCEEDLSLLFADHLGEGFWFAFPMVCFTDMPPRAARAHRGHYGDYAIVVSKDAASKYDIQPVVYLLAEGTVATHIAQTVRPDGGRLQLAPELENPMRPLIPYVKMTPGTQTDREPGREHAWEGLVFEDEMEWRYIAPGDDLPWPESRWRNFIQPKDHDLTASRRLKMEPIYIERIVVPKLSDARKVAAAMPDFSNKLYLRVSGGWLCKVPRWLLAVPRL